MRRDANSAHAGATREEAALLCGLLDGAFGDDWELGRRLKSTLLKSEIESELVGGGLQRLRLRSRRLKPGARFPGEIGR